MQDFDAAKRHVGLVLTQYDPDSEPAKKQFRSIKDYQKRLAKLRMVRFAHIYICKHPGIYARRAAAQPLLS